MPSKKVNQLPQISTLESNDKFLVYDESASTTCYALYSQLGGSSPQLGGGNYIDITASPYNADKTGVNDISSALTSAMGSGGKTIFFPAGTYKINTNLEIPAGTFFIGENKFSTVLNLTHNNGVKFLRNTNASYDQNWLKSGLRDLTIKSVANGIVMDGLEFIVENVIFCGGSPSGVALHVQDGNYYYINNVNFGVGGGNLTLAGKFIKIGAYRGSTGWNSGSAVNYGYGIISNLIGKLTTTNVAALEFDASTYNPSGDKPHIQNLLIQNVTLFTDNKPSGSVGIYLRQVRNCVFKNVNIINFSTAVNVRSDYTVPNSGSNIHNTFIGCVTNQCDNPWVETTNPPGFTNFYGCNNFGPKQPTGTSTTDYSSKRSPYDSALSGTLWFTKPNDGQLKAGIRLSPDGAFYLVGDIDYQANGSTNYDGMPNLVTPTKNLAIGYPDNNKVQIFKTKQLSTLVIGNGENFSHSSVAIGPLHSVQINDPLFLSTFSSTLPTSYNINYNGLLVNITSPTVVNNTEFWVGPGVYSNESFDGTNTKFLPVVSKGRVPVKDIATSSYSLNGTDAQKILRFNYQSSNITLNVDNNLIPSTAANPSEDHRTSFKFTVKAHGNNVVIQPQTNVNLIVGEQENVTNYTIFKGNTVELIYSRNSNNTSNLEVCVPISGSSSTKDLLWADSSADLGGGTGFSWPGLYRKTGTSSWEFESRLNSGIVFRHLPQPTGSGTPSPFSLIYNGGNGTVGHTSVTISNLNIPAGKVVIWINAGRDSNPPTVSSITHPSLSNVTERTTQLHDATSLSRTNRAYFFTAVSSGGTGDLVISYSGLASWSSNVQVFHAPDTAVGNFLGAAFSSPVTSGTQVSISRNSNGSAKVDICVCFAYTSVSAPTLSVSRDSSSYTAGTSYHSYKALGSTRAAGQSIDNTTQTFTVSSGTYVSAIAGIIQFEGPEGGATNYTIESSDLAKKLICQTGTTNITLPVLSLPSGNDSNGQTGIESFLMVEVPPSCTVNFYRGSGAEFWTGPNSGNVSGAVVSCTSNQRKVIVLSVMPSGLWKIVSGEVD